MGMRRKTRRSTRTCYPDRNGRILNYDHSGRSFRAQPLRRRSGAWRVSVLSEVAVGKSGVVVALDLPESVQNHLMHMGFVPDARVVVLRRAPAGDPTVFAIDGMEIALRRETAAAIRVRVFEQNATPDSPTEDTRELAGVIR
jgi:ferrous iron transport protein A